MKRIIERAISSGKKWQSSETGFIHFHPHEGEDAKSIPIKENFLFALALLRSNTAENILEGKSMIEKLLPFQGETKSFPLYLHQYPVCFDRFHGVEILVILYWIQKLYHTVLGGELNQKIEKVKKELLDHAKRMEEEKEAPYGTALRIAAISQDVARAEKLLKQLSLKDPEEIAHVITALQILSFSIPEQIFSTWHSKACSFLGPTPQKELEPVVTLYDLYMGYFSDSFSARAMREHPILLQGALIQPTDQRLKLSEHPFAITHNPFRIVWGTPERTHTFVNEGAFPSSIEENALIFDNEEMIAFYMDVSDEFSFRVDNQVSNTFRLDQTVELHLGISIQLSFHLVEGEGQFIGHIMRGNRPSQQALKGTKRFNSYDWTIFLRTIRTKGPTKIKVNIKLLKS